MNKKSNPLRRQGPRNHAKGARSTVPGPLPAQGTRAGALVELVIEHLGGEGDGVAHYQGKPVFVPFALPGERVEVRLGPAPKIESAFEISPDRVDPPCRHFGTCGGCAVQHLSTPAIASWKRDALVAALGRAGADPSVVGEMVSIPPGRRRRASLSYRRMAGGVVLGFTERHSHHIIDLAECPALLPALADLLPVLRELLATATPVGASGHVALLLADSGLDMLIEGPSPDLVARERLVAFAEAHDLARLSWRTPGQGTEPVTRRRPASLMMGGVPVEPPPAGFLQPSVEGERVLVALVLDAVGDTGAVADLYAGCGSFSLPLAARASVHAVEGDGPSLTALNMAASARGLRVSTERRDLARDPLEGKELARFGAVVFDPPRTGAATQSRALAERGPPLVVAVSCNPVTLSRDARLLIEGGYRLEKATPVDQFPWSSELEAVAVFRR